MTLMVPSRSSANKFYGSRHLLNQTEDEMGDWVGEERLLLKILKLLTV